MGEGMAGAGLERSMPAEPAARFESLPLARVAGVEVPVACGARVRLLGLAFLELERAGPGLLIPRCASVHTFGMRFELDLVFLDARGRQLAVHRSVGPGRLVWRRRAAAVLELPAGESPALPIH
ncbi:MAG TPA: DUF192 domain-containing protein [Solirubrobacterales bacterium]|nr:DUF192 domain-containing protein [Solirubrobacterales bacterium]